MRLCVRSTVDLLASVPYLLGFHPADSLVVVAIRGRRMAFAARGDLLDPAAFAAARASFTEHLVAVVTRQQVDAVSVIGYGAADRVATAMPAVCALFARRGVRIMDAVRVTAGRYWSYFCPDPVCCPPEGIAFDLSTSSLSAAAVFAGQVVLPDRAALVSQVAPAGGSVRESMRLATERARDRLAALIADDRRRRAPAGGDQAVVVSAGRAAVREALARGGTGDQLTDDEVAWLALLLTNQSIRDFAWERATPEHWQQALWMDVLRRVEPKFAPAPASLLAFVAWRNGYGALASVALERALDADPAYSMALVLDQVLRRGVPPSVLDKWPLASSAPPPSLDTPAAPTA